MRYVVPYSAPGIKWGQLRIEAESSADAMTKAQEVHASTVRLSRTGLNRVWPGRERGAYYRPTMKLRQRERSQIVYVEPLALVDAVAS